jgi:hypothetical protein
LLQWYDVLYPQKDKVHSTTKVVDLWEKNSWGAKFSKKNFKKNVRLTPWMEKGTRNLLAQIGSHGNITLMDSKHSKCVTIVGNQDGYGVVYKVQIEVFDHIPSTIELARKTPDALLSPKLNPLEGPTMYSCGKLGLGARFRLPALERGRGLC